MNVKYFNALLAEEEQETQLNLAQSFVANVNEDLNDIKHSFLRIGFRLAEANENEYYKVLGYATLIDLSADMWGFSKSTTYELIGIYRLAHKKDAPLLIDEKYDKFSQSQLREFCRLKYCPDEFIRMIKPSDKVQKIGLAVTFWNKYVAQHSGTPDVYNIEELLELDLQTPLCVVRQLLSIRAERRAKENSAYADKSNKNAGQLPGQIEIDLNDETSECAQNSAYAENEEPKITNGEIQKLSAIDESLSASTSEIIECELIEPEQVQEETELKEDDDEDKEECDFAIKSDDEFFMYCLKEGPWTGTIGKFKIYDKALSNVLSTSEFVEFVTGEYGTRQVTFGIYDKYANSIRASAKGLELERKSDFKKFVLSWVIVAGRIKRLIESNSYLTADEQEWFLKWKSESEPVAATSPVKTQRARLSELSTAELANEIVMKIVKIYPLKGESIKFVSVVRKALVDWLDAPEVQE